MKYQSLTLSNPVRLFLGMAIIMVIFFFLFMLFAPQSPFIQVKINLKIHNVTLAIFSAVHAFHFFTGYLFCKGLKMAKLGAIPILLNAHFMLIFLATLLGFLTIFRIVDLRYFYPMFILIAYLFLAGSIFGGFVIWIIKNISK